jgi:hypothetical protein
MIKVAIRQTVDGPHRSFEVMNELGIAFACGTTPAGDLVEANGANDFVFRRGGRPSTLFQTKNYIQD